MSEYVRELMKSCNCLVTADVSVAAAARLLARYAVADVYVVDTNHRLLGSVSEAALLKCYISQQADTTTVGDLMGHDVPTISSAAELSEAVTRFRAGWCRSLAVVANGRLIGRLQRVDVLRHLSMPAPIKTRGPNFLRANLSGTEETSTIEWSGF